MKNIMIIAMMVLTIIHTALFAATNDPDFFIGSTIWAAAWFTTMSLDPRNR